MTQSKRIATIRAFLEERATCTGQIAEDDDLLLSGLLDSLGVADLVAFLETRFARDIPLSDVTVENFGTLQAIAAYVGQEAEN